jgi:hypothetical protein
MGQRVLSIKTRNFMSPDFFMDTSTILEALKAIGGFLSGIAALITCLKSREPKKEKENSPKSPRQRDLTRW